MLYRARYPHRDIKIWSDNLPSLTYLHVVRNKPSVHGSARRTDRRAKLVGYPFEQLEIFTILHPSTARDNDLRCGQFGPFGFGNFFTHKGGKGCVANALDRFDRRTTALAGNRIETGTSHRNYFSRITGLNGSNRITCIDRPLKRVRRINGNDVRNHLHVEYRRCPRQKILPRGCVSSQDMIVLFGEFSDK